MVGKWSAMPPANLVYTTSGAIKVTPHIRRQFARPLKPAQRSAHTVTPDDLKDLLRHVKYPGFSRDIVSFGLVRAAALIDGTARVALQITTADPQVPQQLRHDIEALLRGKPGVREIMVDIAVAAPKAALRPVTTAATAGPGAPAAGAPLKDVRTIIAVASGKGGVGKSTVAVNLACALARVLAAQGRKGVGLMDCDIHGPSVPLMMGLAGQRPGLLAEQQMLVPLEAFDVKVMSMGLLITEETPVVWRGPMVTSAIRNFIQNVLWGELEILVVDLPPGTGDAQLTLAQTLPLNGALIVTTPQMAATQVATRGGTMFNQVNVPILGVAENMSWFEDAAGTRVALFGEGGGARTAEQLGTTLLGQIPLFPEIRAGGDAGRPIVVAQPGHPASIAFLELAKAVLAKLISAQA
jgi:ATP-binding protein involved in chromosome partitioning